MSTPHSDPPEDPPPAYEPYASPSESKPHRDRSADTTTYLSPPAAGPSSHAAPAPPPQSHSPQTHAPFTPLTLHTRGADLASGFPSVAPSAPGLDGAAVFAARGVRTEDWARFLGELAASGAGSSRGLGGLLASAASHVARRTPPAAAAIVDAWNQSYFHPRALDVTLEQQGTSVDATTLLTGVAVAGAVRKFGGLRARRAVGPVGLLGLAGALVGGAGEPWRLVVSHWPPVFA